MVLRKLCKETAKRPLKALFFFPDEKKTGIAHARIIIEKDQALKEAKKVRAEILALNGK